MDRRGVLAGLTCLATTTLVGCSSAADGSDDDTRGTEGECLAATSGRPSSIGTPAFEDWRRISRRFTCDGENVSPALSVGDVAADADALALIVDDLDAPGGVFTHWLLWEFSPYTESIPEPVPRCGTVESLGDAIQGTNDADENGYSGPCPPRGDGAHTYRFRLIAMAEAIELSPRADRSTFDDTVGDVRRSEAFLRGIYDRCHRGTERNRSSV